MNKFDLEASEDWQRAELLRLSGEVFEGAVGAYNQAGLVVSFGRPRGFIPAAQLTSRPSLHAGEEDWMPKMVGMKLRLKVIEADRSLRRLIFSEH